MEILKHGKFNKFLFRGECPVCGCVFQTVITKSKNGLSYESGLDVVTVFPAILPASVLAICPDCGQECIEMEDVTDDKK